MCKSVYNRVYNRVYNKEEVYNTAATVESEAVISQYSSDRPTSS